MDYRKTIATLPTVMKAISNYSGTNRIYVYDDGVIALTNGTSWTEFYNGGKVRKFDRYEPYSTYEVAAQRYTGDVHEVPDGYESKSPLESLIDHVSETASIKFTNRA